MADSLKAPLTTGLAVNSGRTTVRLGFGICSAMAIIFLFILTFPNSAVMNLHISTTNGFRRKNTDVVEAEHGVVASDDGRCSKIGVNVLKNGGHVVDAAVATALCLGVVNPASSGLGGGGFMLFRSSDGNALAYDLRETAPLAASQDMYVKNESAKSKGPLSIAVPGELAGLHLAWKHHGRLPWKKLVQPALHFATNGFAVSDFLASAIEKKKDYILADGGLREIFAPNGKLLKEGDICYNVKLGQTLQAISDSGAMTFYNGIVGSKLVSDLQKDGGILTMRDLQNYKVKVTAPISSEAMGYTILGMPPPSAGGVGLSFILNIFASYGTTDATKGFLGIHRMIEAFKHMFAIRMNLGDPYYVNVTDTVSKMLSLDFAATIRARIIDNATFSPTYYAYEWSQLKDHGTSHFAIVDAERNSLAMTTTVNSYFGSMVISPSTGIILNNEMDDFSTPSEISPDKLPPATANFISPGKRPLSSMSPTIVLKGQQLVGVLGASGGIHITPTVAQVYIEHFLNGMDPFCSVMAPRVFHELIPNVVEYENFTTSNGDHIEFSKYYMLRLMEIGHKLKGLSSFVSECHLIVQDFTVPIDSGKNNSNTYGLLTAVSDPRKNGIPAGF